jgi:hypothetical protein
MNLPTFLVQWVDPNDTTLGMDFFPPKGSDELHEALRQYYPHLTNLQARMRQASIDFLLTEGQASPLSERPTPNYLPSPSSIPSSAVASPPDATLSAAQNVTSQPKQEDLMNVWTLPSNPDAKIHKRRTMTAEEKRAYKQKRLDGACADCKRRRRKCVHGTSPAPSSSSSCKTSVRKARSKPSLGFSPSHSDAFFPPTSIEQCLLPEPQPLHEVAFNLFADLPVTLDGTPALPEMELDLAMLDTEFLELNKDWDLFPDAQYDINVPLQTPYVDNRQRSVVDTSGQENFYPGSVGGFDPWSPSLDYQSMPQQSPDQAYASAYMSSDQPLARQASSSAVGLFPTPSLALQTEAFHRTSSVMETSPSSSSQGSFSDTGHVPGGSYVSPSTTASSDMLTDPNDFSRTTDLNSVPGPLFKGRNRHEYSPRQPSQLEEWVLQELATDDQSDSRPPQLNLSVSGRRIQHDPRDQSSGNQDGFTSSPLAHNLTADRHVIGISRSKKPEQIDSTRNIASTLMGLDILRAQTIVSGYPQAQTMDAGTDRSQFVFRGDHELKSHQPQWPLEMSPSITSGTDTAESAFASSFDEFGTFSSRSCRSPTDRTTSASTHYLRTGTVYAPRATSVNSVTAVGGLVHSLFKPGHQSLPSPVKAPLSTRWREVSHDVSRHIGVSDASFMRPSVPLGAKLAGLPAQTCLAAVYFFLVRESSWGRKMNGMFLGAMLAVLLFVLSHGFGLR